MNSFQGPMGLLAFFAVIFGYAYALDRKDNKFADELLSPASLDTFTIPKQTALRFNSLAVSAWGIIPSGADPSVRDQIPVMMCFETSQGQIHQKFGALNKRGVSGSGRLHPDHIVYQQDLCSKTVAPSKTDNNAA